MLSAALALLASFALHLGPQNSEVRDAAGPVATLQFEAERLAALVECKGTKAFLAATKALPEIGARSVLYDEATRAAVTPEELARLAPAERTRFHPTEYGPEFYYSTYYGTPLAYARVLDLVGKLAGKPGEDRLSGRRILDFGYGGIGHLRLLASLGCDAVGVDVDSLLAAYYQASDQGAIPSSSGGAPGKLALVNGRWPADAATKSAVGAGFDLVLSKNVLKKGYVRPAQKVDPSQLVDFGIPPEQFLPEIARILKPGGVFAIYNLCPGPRQDRYLARAYGESPFTREEFAAAGFELLAFDVDDRAQAQELGFALQWDKQGMDLENDLFAWYTIARRREG
jgi:SAM-dependent methyltransferase